MGDDDLWYNMDKRHGLVYFGPFSVGLFSDGLISGKWPKTENKPWAYFWCQRFLNNFGRFPKISHELILSEPRYKTIIRFFYWSKLPFSLAQIRQCWRYWIFVDFACVDGFEFVSSLAWIRQCWRPWICIEFCTNLQCWRPWICIEFCTNSPVLTALNLYRVLQEFASVDGLEFVSSFCTNSPVLTALNLYRVLQEFVSVDGLEFVSSFAWIRQCWRPWICMCTRRM